MNIPGAETIIVFLTIIYLIGILLTTSVIYFLSLYLFKRPISYIKTIANAIVGFSIGVFISIIAFQIYSPTNLIYGNEDFSEKLSAQNQLMSLCIYFPILTISVFIIISVIRQIKLNTNKVL